MYPPAYVMIFVNGYYLDKFFYIKCSEKVSARDIFKDIDSYKKTLNEDQQERLNIHVWGEYEFEMLSGSGSKLTELKSVDEVIVHTSVLLG